MRECRRRTPLLFLIFVLNRAGVRRPGLYIGLIIGVWLAVFASVLQSPGSGCPLRARARPDRFKIVFLDVGLTQALLGLDTAELILDPATAITHRGATAEAFVGQEMIAYASLCLANKQSA